MKFATSCCGSARAAQRVSRVASTRSAVQALSGVQVVAGADGAELRATDMEVGLRVPLEPRGRARGHGRPARAPPARRRPLAAGRPRRRSSCAPPSRTSRSCRARRRSTSARCAPRTSRRCPSPAATPSSTVPAAAFVETINRVARSASRDETRPILTGILVSASGVGAADGRDRLLPPERQGDEARGAARRRLRGQRPGARAAGARADRPGRRRRGAHASRCAPTRSSSRSAATSSPRASSTVSSRTTASCCPTPTSTS